MNIKMLCFLFQNCSNNARGDKCQFCKDGYYGNATLGPGSCMKCECPLGGAGNKYVKMKPNHTRKLANIMNQDFFYGSA
jgi:hypothetical protein